MRLNELLGHRVIDADGEEIGGVSDVRLVQDGPMLVSMQRSLRIDGLIVVEKRVTRLFGYERHVGPALLRRLVHLRLGEVWYLPWNDIEHIADGLVTTTARRTDLCPLEQVARY
ncbi:PRC-barrel domain-containing protein [Kribbella sp. NPDC055110]